MLCAEESSAFRYDPERTLPECYKVSKLKAPFGINLVYSRKNFVYVTPLVSQNIVSICFGTQGIAKFLHAWKILVECLLLFESHW